MSCCVSCRVVVRNSCNCKKQTPCPSDESTLMLITLIVVVSAIALGFLKTEEPKKPTMACCCWFNCKAEDSSDIFDLIKLIILKVAITAAVVVGGVFVCFCSNGTEEAQSKSCDDCYNEKTSFQFFIGFGVVFGLIFLFFCFSSLIL